MKKLKLAIHKQIGKKKKYIYITSLGLHIGSKVWAAVAVGLASVRRGQGCACQTQPVPGGSNGLIAGQG